jgi:CRISPR-associated protein Cas2
MESRKIFCVIAYDVSDDKCRSKVVKILERYGVRVNFSVFECMLTPLQLKTIKSSIMPLLDVRSDSVVYYTICLNCYTKIEYQPPKKSNSKVIMVK